MPLFEYKCGNCGAMFEQLMRSSAERPDACPECGGTRLEKQFSSFSAAVHEHDSFPCSPGHCPTESCATRGCPFGKS